MSLFEVKELARLRILSRRWATEALRHMREMPYDLVPTNRRLNGFPGLMKIDLSFNNFVRLPFHFSLYVFVHS